MELPYFKHFELPVSLVIDQVALKAKFYALSKKYHPDFYLNADKDVQADILELSTLTNKAYQTLTNPDALLTYILSASGVLKEGEKDSLSPDFLMEMMDFNEELMNLEFDFDAEKLTTLSSQLQSLIEDNDQLIKQLFNGFVDKNDAEQLLILEKVKENYYKKKYFLRIQEKVFIFASR